MGKVITTKVIQEYCVPRTALVIFNEPTASATGLVYRQSVRVTYDVFTPEMKLIKSFDELLVIEDRETPADLAAIENGFKGPWTDLLISDSQAVITKETT